MRVVLIGTLVYDTIQSLEGDEIHGFGGIYHTLIALSALLSSKDVIIPITYVTEEYWDRILQLISNHDNVSLEGLVRIKTKMNQSILKYYTDSERHEISKDPFPELKFEHIEPHLACDIIAINMISGWDIQLSTLKKIRKNYNGEIYIDIHNYLTEIDQEGKRSPRKPADIREWLQLTDIIQLNEREFDIINPEKLNIRDFCLKYCISERKLINLTLGASGSQSLLLHGGKTKSYLNKITANVNSCDTTGCGDAFMAGFIYGHLNNMDINECLKVANCIASIYSEFPGPADIEQIKLKFKKRCLN
jgi:sugar/nucleoside kinase (ribokinase family)